MRQSFLQGRFHPKVSIFIPTYQQVDYLRKVLDSIALQNFQDYEVIVSDDSSDDRVQQLTDHYGFGGQLRYFRNRPPLGTPTNWNAAIRRTRGEYLKPMLYYLALALHGATLLQQSSRLKRFLPRKTNRF